MKRRRTEFLLLTCLCVLATRPAWAQETIEYYGVDAVHSTRVVFAADGTVLSRADYLPFGEELQTSPLPAERFTGQERDAEAGLDYFRARFYAPRTGRFTRVDPLGGKPEMPQTWNRYAYALNNPLTFTDPTGKGPFYAIGPALGPLGMTLAMMGLDVPADMLPNMSLSVEMTQDRSPSNYTEWAAAEFGDLATLGDHNANSDAAALPPLFTPTRGDRITFAATTIAAAIVVPRIAGGALGAIAGEEAAAVISDSGMTTLYRAVGPAELADIQATGILRNLGSAEGKYFTTTAEAASSYAKQAVKGFGDPPYTLIETRVPNSIFEGLTPATVDRGIPAWVIPNDRLPGLVPTVLDRMAVPRTR